jgi:hypothetical protein
LHYFGNSKNEYWVNEDTLVKRREDARKARLQARIVLTRVAFVPVKSRIKPTKLVRRGTNL